MSANRALSALASEIVVGQPLPFSVFGGANKLLLARGQIVESESMRDSLLTHGVTCDPPPSISPNVAGEFTDAETANCPADPLLAWREEYAKSANRYRIVLQMARDESSASYASWLIGMHENAFLVTSPRGRDNAPIDIQVGQSWVFRAFVGTSVTRFHAPIRQLASAPFDHVYVGRPEKVEQRRVRGAPRAPVCLDATLGAGGGISSVIVDLSACGARVAVRSSVDFAKGDRVLLQSALPLLGRTYALCNECTVATRYESLDARSPDVIFYGLRFSKISETDELALHGYVHQQLSVGVNSLGELMGPE